MVGDMRTHRDAAGRAQGPGGKCWSEGGAPRPQATGPAGGRGVTRCSGEGTARGTPAHEAWGTQRTQGTTDTRSPRPLGTQGHTWKSRRKADAGERAHGQEWLHQGAGAGSQARTAKDGAGWRPAHGGVPPSQLPDQAHTAQLHAHKRQRPRHQPAAETQHTALRSHAVRRF